MLPGPNTTRTARLRNYNRVRYIRVFIIAICRGAL